MYTGIDRKEVLEYISVMDPDKENPTKFLLGALSCKDKLSLTARFEEKDTDVYYDTVRKGLKGIKGLKLKSGEVKDYNMITDAVMNLFSDQLDLVKELFFKIVDINFMSEQETKN